MLFIINLIILLINLMIFTQRDEFYECKTISWLGHLERMEEDRTPKKNLHSRTGRDKKMERGSRKRSSSAGSEKMERVGGR